MTNNFIVDSATGSVSLIASPTLDREMQAIHELIIVVQDKGTPSLSTTATLSVILLGMTSQILYITII